MINKLVFIVTLLFTFSVYAGTNIGQDPYCILNMPFSEPGGSILIDHSREDNNGDIKGNPVWTDDGGWCLDFDGTNDYVDVADSESLDLTTVMTISAWIRRDTTGTNDIILAKSAGGSANTSYFLNITADNKVDVWLSSSVNNYVIWHSTNTITDTKQHNIIIVFDGSQAIADMIDIYIDGVSEVVANFPTGSFTGTMLDSSENVNIGCYGDGTGYFFNGIIDEVKIYNRALTAPEIKSIYNKGRKDLKKLR